MFRRPEQCRNAHRLLFKVWAGENHQKRAVGSFCRVGVSERKTDSTCDRASGLTRRTHRDMVPGAAHTTSNLAVSLLRPCPFRRNMKKAPSWHDARWLLTAAFAGMPSCASRRTFPDSSSVVAPCWGLTVARRCQESGPPDTPCFFRHRLRRQHRPARQHRILQLSRRSTPNSGLDPMYGCAAARPSTVT